jgi:hypothetical protein
VIIITMITIVLAITRIMTMIMTIVNIILIYTLLYSITMITITSQAPYGLTRQAALRKSPLLSHSSCGA